MPQVRLETSRRVAEHIVPKALFAPLHHALVEIAGAGLIDCKSRIVVQEGFYIADGNPDRDIAHLDISLLAGRTPEVKIKLGETARDLLAQHLKTHLPGREIAISVRIVDMNRDEYWKATVGA